ncbi:F-box/kelch-repeat protein At3g23880-like [Mercurialis annua]|uniref:F-box/kelch-repeat protein At3g23880-like n=1 Tax=Mercurialis annua TaxID=3986 RepID=UPI00216043BB|nr:F-box/kelch-repeat protein At3g23880-like [Mercurialis annua]
MIPLQKKFRVMKEKIKALHIPPDILFDIFLRLPPKSLIRFKSVHSSWLSLISSPNFRLKHLHHARASSSYRHGILKSEDTYLSLHGLRQLQATGNLELPPIPEPENTVDMKASVVSSCNGLLLLCISYKNRRDFILWNPSIREHITIRKSSFLIHNTYMCGLVFDEFNDNYEVVDVCFDRYGNNSEVEVYNLKENRWNRKSYRIPTDDDDNDGRPYINNEPGITLRNGIPHWIIRIRNFDTLTIEILSIDLVQVKFKKLPLPPPLANPDPNPCNIVIPGRYRPAFMSTLHGNLCVGIPGIGNLKVWVMKEYGVAESWIKLSNMVFPVDLPRISCILMPLDFIGRDEVVMGVGRNSLKIYDRKNFQYSDDIYIHRLQPWPTQATYIETLVSPNVFPSLTTYSGFRRETNDLPILFL